MSEQIEHWAFEREKAYWYWTLTFQHFRLLIGGQCWEWRDRIFPHYRNDANYNGIAGFYRKGITWLWFVLQWDLVGDDLLEIEI